MSKIKFVAPQKSLSATFYKLPVLQSEIEKLSSNLKTYINQGKDEESEEYHKGLIKDFLANTWYNPDYSVNTNGREDLVIYNGNGTESKPAVIIEAKSPTNTSEMFSEKNLNCKALQECVYYFMQESIKFGNKEVKHIIITDYTDFYIFDAKDFSRFFLAKTNPILEQFNLFEAKQLSDTKTSYFYENCAKPAIDKWFENENITVTHFSPTDYYEKQDEKLVVLYKILSPEHLLNKPFANDSNSLDRNFYAELLHIIGLEEIKDGGKELIRRKVKERNRASLLESAIYQLEDKLSDEKRIFETALNLSITWVNRLLFLKLLESQQLAYQKGNADYRFLTIEKIDSFDELNLLFFKVLGRRVEERDKETGEKYSHVPYLNSSLFELSEEEHLLQIHGIQNKPLSLYSKTVLKDEKGRRLTGEMDNLEYIFKFLDAYNFSSEGPGGITQISKTLINASVLGLIFEKINGYKDGSFYTPGFITEYMAKEAIERAVVQKFNDIKGWKCETLDDVANEIEDRKEANQIINSIRICDPAVGSGHFLVSALNRLLFIKSYLNILLDKDGKRIKNSDWELRLENDEISVLDEDGNPFIYTTNAERQRVQEMIFNEKRTIIENCLFGVDINPASVYICRLRLWIELLKNTYYTAASGYTQLETLPNIDINIKCGNSLISKFPVNVGNSIMKSADNSVNTTDFRKRIKEYRDAVSKYKNESNKENKRNVENRIEGIKNKICSEVQLDLFDKDWNEKASSDSIYKNSLEWMLEFPEVLDDNGNFTGFDVVIANPPFGVLFSEEEKKYISKHYQHQDYQPESYLIFIEKGINIMKKQGVLSYIIPNTWLLNLTTKKIRRYIFESTSLVEIVHLKDYVFNAIVDTEIVSLINKEPLDEKIRLDVKSSKGELMESSYINQNDLILKQGEAVSLFIKNDYLSLVNKLTSFKKLDYYCKITQGTKPFQVGKGVPKQTREDVERKEFISVIPQKGFRPLLRGNLMNRYKILWNNNYWIKYGEWLAEPRPSANYDAPEKIIIRQTGDSLVATIDKEQFIVRDNLYTCIGKSSDVSLSTILGQINSKVLNWYYQKVLNPEEGEALAQVKRGHLIQLPIASEQDCQLETLVTQMLEGNGTDKLIEREIDIAVYRLYGLTYDEVLIVDPETEVTREEYEKN